MSKKIKTVQQELESMRETKQSIYEWLFDQNKQPADVYEFIENANQLTKTGEKNNEKIN